MKKIEIFFPTKVDSAKLEQSLKNSGARTLSLVEMLVFNNGPAKTEKYRGVERIIPYSTKIKAEVIVDDEHVEAVGSLLESLASLEQLEQTKAFISDLT
jgi:nitrogen regulatory protein PII